MLLKTPEDLGVKLVVAAGQSRSFAVCHPGDDGPPDLSTSIVFEIAAPHFKAIRIFDTEIVSMAWLDDILYCVDSSQHMYSYADGQWTDHGNPDLRPYRINDLRVCNRRIFGIGNDRMIFTWEPNGWAALTKEKKDLFLYDIADWGTNGYAISGEAGFLAALKDGAFRVIELPTNADITCVMPVSAERLLVTGWDATILYVGFDEMILIDAGERDLNFLNAVRWNSRLLIAGEVEILELKGDNLETFAAQSATLLSTNGDRLWRQGFDGIGYLDPGSDWVAVELEIDL